ncbi:MAG TPA: DUF5693 family protein, partial [Armatimonadota bacterium]|nr:DUF5693 family protein [Armatimonadota bacterium]
IILPAIKALLVAAGITLLGALSIAAMMAESTYLVKIGQFSGVKIALSVPLLLFAVMIITDGVAKGGETFADYIERARVRIHGFFSQPLYIWGAILGVVALGIVGIMLARSGNDGGVGVSGAELRLRSLLEQGMIARPRTKEFLFGFPMFIFSMVAAAHRRRLLALVLLIGGAVGQVDVLNTYCHAHTPVLLSLLRTFNGMWLGIIIGVAILFLFARQTVKPSVEPAEVTE